MLFGGKKPDARTFLLLDVENGSVGGALVRLKGDEAPRLFAERRVHLPARLSRSATEVFGSVKNASRKVLSELAEVAARLRQHPKTSALGNIDRAAIFMAPPWGLPDLQTGRPHFSPATAEMLQSELSGFFEIPASFYTSAGALYRGARQVMGYERDYMLVGIGGETSELLLIADGVVTGHAVFPVGSHTVLRTLRAHADLTPTEARRILAEPMERRGTYREPLSAAGQHFAGSFASAAEPLLKAGDTGNVYTASHAGADFFARSLSDNRQIAELFPQGGVVRVLRPAHAAPHLSAHAEHPDLWLMLEALFATAL